MRPKTLFITITSGNFFGPSKAKICIYNYFFRKFSGPSTAKFLFITTTSGNFWGPVRPKFAYNCLFRKFLGPSTAKFLFITTTSGNFWGPVKQQFVYNYFFGAQYGQIFVYNYYFRNFLGPSKAKFLFITTTSGNFWRSTAKLYLTTASRKIFLSPTATESGLTKPAWAENFRSTGREVHQESGYLTLIFFSALHASILQFFFLS